MNGNEQFEIVLKNLNKTILFLLSEQIFQKINQTIFLNKLFKKTRVFH